MSEQPSSFRQTLSLLNRHKVIFTFFFLFMFAASFTLLYMLDLVPSQLDVISNDDPATSTVAQEAQDNKITIDQVPVRIIINTIGVNATIQDPTTTNIDALDDLLLKGVVRYPGSGFLGKGNLYLFGHSTGLKVVNNQAFRSFDNFKELKPGDIINVYSETKNYTYKVRDVKMVTSEAAWVDFSVTTNMLTLSTCNTFAQKDDRYIVEADYVGNQPL